MENKRVIVFRVNYDDAHDYILKEIGNGILRQGWGVEGTSLLDGNNQKVEKDIWIEKYSKSWNKEISIEEASKRFFILSRILDIKKGDLIVIPKTINSQTLSICTVEQEYWFDSLSSTFWSDFRHCIGISNVRSYAYDSCSEAKLISSKFIAYQSAINNVWAERFVENVHLLYKREDNFKSATIRQLFLQIKAKSIEHIVPHLLDIGPSSFEDIIAECLKSKGYNISAMRKYDGDGADADIVATFPLPLLSTFEECSPTILIQVKKKVGTDSDDIAGIKQLVMSRQKYENPICILMHTSVHISTDSEKYANKENIKIINGNQLIEFILTSDLSKT
jgi:predicted Mrr-cat superfamily restriction endonuclease